MARNFPRFTFSIVDNAKSPGIYIHHNLDPLIFCKVHMQMIENSPRESINYHEFYPAFALELLRPLPTKEDNNGYGVEIIKTLNSMAQWVQAQINLGYIKNKKENVGEVHELKNIYNVLVFENVITGPEEYAKRDGPFLMRTTLNCKLEILNAKTGEFIHRIKIQATSNRPLIIDAFNELIMRFIEFRIPLYGTATIEIPHRLKINAIDFKFTGLFKELFEDLFKSEKWEYVKYKPGSFADYTTLTLSKFRQ